MIWDLCYMSHLAVQCSMPACDIMAEASSNSWAVHLSRQIKRILKTLAHEDTCNLMDFAA